MKYLIYKGTGGLVHMLNGLQAAIEICKKENRILIIDTKKTGSFKNNFDNYFFIYDKNLKYFTNYDNIDHNLFFEDIPILNIENHGTKLINNKYYLTDSNYLIQDLTDMNDKNVRIYAGYYHEYIQNIRLQNNILYETFDNTIEYINQYKPYISVHFRNTDMKNSLIDFKKKIKNASNKYNIKNIFIATDDYNAFDNFKKSFQDLTFFKVCDAPNCDGKNIHYHFNNKDTLIKNTLKDMYMIIKSKYFIPSINSGISKWIIHQQKYNEHNLFDDDYNFIII